ncbi:MAG TPA: SLC13 family permease [Candidatus Polarisedimenticolia bacterium]|nr:SLC13 family permease [Candidatus Polarisedimenticolia bacterium]
MPSAQTGLVLILVVLAVINFSFEWLAIEVFSLLVMVILAVSGVLSPAQAFMGFANSAVIMIGGVMILTGAIIHNGAADIIARQIQRFAGSSERRMGVLLIAAENLVSSVINNVAATAMFIPVAEGMARRFKINRGKYLMPIAFASMTGGMCTLIGTSTNVAVAGAMEQHGLKPLGLFELTPVGLVVAVVGAIYLLWASQTLLNRPPDEDAVDAYGIKGFLFEVLVREGAAVAGKTISQASLGQKLGLNVLAIVRGTRRIVSPPGTEMVLVGDLLLVEGEARTIPVVVGTRGLDVKSMPATDRIDLESDKVKMVEATISYNSPFIGQSLKELNFRHRFDLSVLAIHRRGEVVLEKIGKIRLRAGDVLLIYGREEMFDRLGQEPAMLLLESVVLPQYNPARALIATFVFFVVILAAGIGWLDTPTAFLAGGALVMAFKCLSADEAGSYLNIRFLVMLAGMSSLGMAMEQSGAARFMANGLVSLVHAGSPLALMSAFFLLTVVLTQPLSNAAAALLVLPVAIRAAHDTGIDPRSFAIAVTIAASCSFITPFEPACLLVYSTGRYHFRDFVKVGAPLTLIAYLISLVMIPLIWPFKP